MCRWPALHIVQLPIRALGWPLLRCYTADRLYSLQMLCSAILIASILDQDEVYLSQTSYHFGGYLETS